MRYALVDDATLEAAEKMEGTAVTRNSLEVPGGILALENLVQAILFSDQILYLDDKRSKRKQKSKIFEQFRRVVLDDDSYNRLLDVANKMTDNYIPCIEGGRFTDEFFTTFFRSLDMDMSFSWEKKADIFCLTPKILRDEKNPDSQVYKKLLNMMLFELSGKSFLNNINTRLPLLYDSEGQIINNCYLVKDSDGKEYPTKLSRQTEELFKALNYMAFRANLHFLAAKELKADLVLSPIRSVFQWGGYNYFGLEKKGSIPLLKNIVHDNILQQSGSSQHGRTNHIIIAADRKYPALILYEIPLFSFWIAEHMEEGSGFIKKAYELREEKEFVTLRRMLTEISNAGGSGSNRTVPLDQIMKKLNHQFGKIAAKYRIKSRKGSPASTFAMISSISPSHINAWPALQLEYSLVPENPPISPARRNNLGIIHRSVLEDMIRVEELGEYFDAITSGINYGLDTALQDIRIETNGVGGMKLKRTAPM